MKLKYLLKSVKIGDKMQMVPVGSKTFNVVITVNETMKDIMDLLAQEWTEDELVDAMMDRYEDVTREEMTAAVRDICDGLRKEGLLTD